MQIRNRILGVGLATIFGLAVMAAPISASAADHHRGSRDDHRTNAALLGIAGVILVGNHKDTLGAIALGAAAVEASKANDRRDDRRYRRGRNDDWVHAVIRDGRNNRRDRDRDCDDRYSRDRNRRDRDDDRYNRERDRDRDRDRDRRDRDRDCDDD